MALKHVGVSIHIKLTKAFNNLVLAWCIDLFKRLLHLCLQFGALHIRLSDPNVFRVEKELEVPTFLLKLSECIFPLNFVIVLHLFDLNDLKVKFVVFFSHALVFFLQRH